RRFANGATVFPGVLFFVDTPPATGLGLAAGRVAVRSVRSAYEKPPWRDQPRLEGTVEAEFVHPVVYGDSLLPYRLLAPRAAVLPLEADEVLDGTNPRIDMYPGLASWWRQAESVWLSNRSSERLTLAEQLDFRKKLTSQ